jgi:uncharacterized protein (TIGR02996 family)
MVDFTSAAFQALLAVGRQRGYLRYAQVNEFLGAGEAAPEDLDRLLVVLEQEGIELVDDREAEERGQVEEALHPARHHEPVGDPAMHQAFLADVVANPEDDAPRLVYADWLDEHGSAWGEFIRVQCALARMDEDDPRGSALRARERELERLGWWEPPRPEGVRDRRFERGMIEWAQVDFDWFLDRAAELFRWAPIRRLDLASRYRGTWPPDRVSELGGRPELARLLGLSMGNLGLWDEHLEALLASPHLSRLKTLSLRRHVGHAARLLSETRSLPALESLDLGDNEVIDEELALLMTAPFAPHLRELRLDLNDPEYRGISDAGLRVLAAAPLCRLRVLCLARNHFTADGVAALANSPNLSALAELELGAWIGWSGEFHPVAGLAEVIASSPLAARLVSLDLHGHALGPAGAAALAAAPLPRLRRLDLSANALGDEGLRVLLAAPWTSGLRTLRLGHNGISPAELRLLAADGALPRLEELG